MDSVTGVWEAIVETLKEMGATSVQQGEPYGLRDYASASSEALSRLFP